MGIYDRTDKLFRIFVLPEKVVFLHNMMCSVNIVITSVVGVFIHSLVYSKLCNFACVSTYDIKSKIKRCVTAKFAASVVS